MRRLGTNWAGIKPKPQTVDGIRFPSSSEARRYGVLRLEEKAGLIKSLEVHVKLPLVINGKKIGRGWIEIDFRYQRDGAVVFEDHKAVMTREAQQRIQMAEALHGITVAITGGKPVRRKMRRAA